MGYSAVLASTTTICLYVAYLAKTLKFTSVKPHIKIIRIMHAEWNLANPLENNYTLTCTLKGIRRHLRDNVARKKPFTPQLLHVILAKLDFTKSLYATIWAACLVMFYGLLPRSNVMQYYPLIKISTSGSVI